MALVTAWLAEGFERRMFQRSICSIAEKAPRRSGRASVICVLHGHQYS